MQKLLIPALALGFLALPVRAADQPNILTAGPGQAFDSPAIAVRLARPGDTVRIAPGRYTSCLWVIADGLTIEGMAPGVVFDGGICGGKAIVVASARDLTLRNLTLTNAHNEVHNGAGIRAEGVNLTVEDVRFIDNDEGILAAARPQSHITVRRSTFRGNGNCIRACAHGLYVGAAALLRVEQSDFTGQLVGHHIKSRAARTEVVDNRIADGAEGTSSYLLDLPAGGTILVSGNQFEKGARSENPGVAIAIGAEVGHYRNPDGPIDIRDNSFVSNTGKPSVFVRNYISVPARLKDNKLTGAVTPLLGSGAVE